MKPSFSYGYGIRIQDEMDPWDLQEALKEIPAVHHMSAWDMRVNFIFISQTDGPEIGYGQYIKINPYEEPGKKYTEWDWILVDTAQKLGLEILDGPAWFFIEDYV